jgi:hypothetical protein
MWLLGANVKSTSARNIAKLYKECLDARKSYEDALTAFQAYRRKRGLDPSPEPSPSQEVSTTVVNDREQTFEDIEESIKQIERSVEATVDQLHGAEDEKKQRHEQQWVVVKGLRIVFRKFAENARSVRSFVSLVPGDAGFGVAGLVCGGINVLLKAAEQHVLMDKHMEHALGVVQETIVHKAYRFHRQEPDDQMHRLISGLFAKIFAVLEKLLRWVHHRTSGMLHI